MLLFIRVLNHIAIQNESRFHVHGRQWRVVRSEPALFVGRDSRCGIGQRNAFRNRLLSGLHTRDLGLRVTHRLQSVLRLRLLLRELLRVPQQTRATQLLFVERIRCGDLLLQFGEGPLQLLLKLVELGHQYLLRPRVAGSQPSPIKTKLRQRGDAHLISQQPELRVDPQQQVGEVLAKVRERGVIELLPFRQPAEIHADPQRRFQLPARPDTREMPVNNDRRQHPRMHRPCSQRPVILSFKLAPIERPQDRVEVTHEMILGNDFLQRRRKQHQLIPRHRRLGPNHCPALLAQHKLVHQTDRTLNPLETTNVRAKLGRG